MPDRDAARRVGGGLTLDICGILNSLPHRYPMLLVDRIDHLEPGLYAEGVKCVTVDEPFLVGHFPDYPIMPGVLIVDALAQVGGIMLRERPSPRPPGAVEPPPPAARPGLLASIQKMRFLRPVLPGDQLRLQVRHLRSLGATHQVKAEAFVNGDLAATGELVLAL